MAMNIFVCRYFPTRRQRTHVHQHKLVFFANRQNCNTTENDLLALINQMIQRHCNTRIPPYTPMTHIRAFAIWLDAVYQFWLCVALSIGSNDTCSPISITFIINVYLFDCISNVRFERFYYFFWFGTIWNVCMFIFHAIFCFKCVYFFLDFFLQFYF